MVIPKSYGYVIGGLWLLLGIIQYCSSPAEDRRHNRAVNFTQCEDNNDAKTHDK